MSMGEHNLPKHDTLRLRWAALLIIGVAAILWAGIAVLAAAWLVAAGGKVGTDGQKMVEANKLSQSFRTAARQVLPSVVVIKTSSKSQTIHDSDWIDLFPMSDFEGAADEEAIGWQPSMGESESAIGSGVVIDAKGIILTNNHVIEDTGDLVVQLADGRQFPATIESSDPGLDLAVLRVQSETPLPAARLGDSDGLEIGDWVLAMGSPFELEQTVSAGIISAKGRSLDSAGSAKLLQTDAAINPGSSGGPLVNLAGEVVGITTAIASKSGGYQGIAFAVPINLAKPQSGHRGGLWSMP